MLSHAFVAVARDAARLALLDPPARRVLDVLLRPRWLLLLLLLRRGRRRRWLHGALLAATALLEDVDVHVVRRRRCCCCCAVGGGLDAPLLLRAAALVARLRQTPRDRVALERLLLVVLEHLLGGLRLLLGRLDPRRLLAESRRLVPPHRLREVRLVHEADLALEAAVGAALGGAILRCERLEAER